MAIDMQVEILVMGYPCMGGSLIHRKNVSVTKKCRATCRDGMDPETCRWWDIVMH